MEPWSLGVVDPGAFMAHSPSPFDVDMPNGAGNASARSPPTDATSKTSTLSDSNITDENHTPEGLAAGPVSLCTIETLSPALQEIVNANQSL